jgi:hypothetical protein
MLLFLIAALSGCMPRSRGPVDQRPPRQVFAENSIFGQISDTQPRLPGRISIQSVGNFDFDPGAIATTRDDVFRDGFFSVFDILVHLDQRNRIDLEYHFDPRLDTHVIDSLNGEPNWWYRTFYDGGWSENNVFRMDLFPYKDRMQIRIFPQRVQRLEQLYDLFREQVSEKRRNRGTVVVREVIIRGPTARLRFENVEVHPHNLRADLFQEGVVTAVDVIMSLGDRGLLSYDLQWHESIGEARIVQNYYVERINEDRTEMRCGFVYEAGALAYRGRGNHIHLPPDSRVIHAPEYLEFFWICV